MSKEKKTTFMPNSKKGINARYLPRLRSDLYLDNSYLQQLDIKEGIRFDKKTLTVLFSFLSIPRTVMPG